MNRDETVALFLECEAKRAEARAAALAEGKDKVDAETAAHEAAKAHWNAWAEPLLAKREAMEADGRWAAEKDWRGSLKPKNAGTAAWMDKATAIFSRCLFLLQGVEGTKETAEEEKENAGNEQPVKSIQLEGGRADLSGFVFPGYASFKNVTFSGKARFYSATFSGNASFDSTDFSGYASFDSATFSGNASFGSTTFEGSASFDSATFSGNASFDRGTFSGNASFGSATFDGSASFNSATFNSNASFDRGTFSGNASFDSATFRTDASFDSTTFRGDASFGSAAFSGTAQFGNVTVGGNASFDGVTFGGDASLGSTIFSGNASFDRVTFGGSASFDSVIFDLHTSFDSATFSGNASFDQTKFAGDALFSKVSFSGNASFDSAAFRGNARFVSATFSRNALFADTLFRDKANFEDIGFHGDAQFDRSKFESVSFNRAAFESYTSFIQVLFSSETSFVRASFGKSANFDDSLFAGACNLTEASFVHLASFRAAVFRDVANFDIQRAEKLDLSGARFSTPPDLNDAGAEAASVDNLRIQAPSLFWQLFKKIDPLLATRFRRYKKTAIKDCDSFSEHEFFVGELVGRILSHNGRWSVITGLGLVYEFFSNFGRSVIRPAVFWFGAIVLGAVFYASQSPTMLELRAEESAAGGNELVATLRTAFNASQTKKVPCYAGEPAPVKDKNGDMPLYVGGLSLSLQNGTDVANEAWHLAFRNALIVLDGSAEAAHRTFGCLYGVELYGGSNPLAIVPSAVSTVSAMQKLFSALMIFLFGLALRNMLKMK